MKEQDPSREELLREIQELRTRIAVLEEAGGLEVKSGPTFRENENLLTNEDFARKTLFLHGLLESMPDLIFLKDSAGVYLDCNPKFAELAGRPCEEIHGLTDYDLFPKELADLYCERDRLTQESGAPTLSEEHITYPDGRTAFVETFKAPLRLGGGTIWGIVGAARDITTRKLFEQRLRESEENFRTFFETLDDLIMVATPEGRIKFTNAAFRRKLGFDRDEIHAMHVLDVHPPDKRHEAERIFAEMFRGERNFCPLPLQKKSGALMPAETRVWFGRWSGEDCVFGVSKDLSKEQEALQKFNRLFSANPAAMALTELPERRFSEVNDSFLTMLGYTGDQVIGKTSVELGLFADPEQAKEVAEALQKEGGIRNMQLRVRTKHGAALEGLFSGEIIESQGKLYCLSLMLDITQTKQGRTRLRRERRLCAPS